MKTLVELEEYFADHFDTLLFPMLAERYLLSGDLARARRVCAIGLSHHPDHVPGLFTLARAALAEGKKREAERLLRKVVSLDGGHFTAHLLCAEVCVEVTRSRNTVRGLYRRVLEMDPWNKRARRWMEEDARRVAEAAPARRSRRKGKSEAPSPPLKESGDALASLTITPLMATFTLVSVLRGQKLYDQALQALVVMEGKKGTNHERLVEVRREILEEMKREGV